MEPLKVSKVSNDRTFKKLLFASEYKFSRVPTEEEFKEMKEFSATLSHGYYVGRRRAFFCNEHDELMFVLKFG